MSSRPQRRRRLPEAVEPGGLEEGPVEVVRTSAGEVFFKPSVRPRSWDRLSEEGQFLLSGIQRLAAEMAELESHLDQHVREARELGASWDVIGWSLGLTATGVRKRYGDVEDGPEGP